MWEKWIMGDFSNKKVEWQQHRNYGEYKNEWIIVTVTDNKDKQWWWFKKNEW